jgi:hypothetical protein
MDDAPLTEPEHRGLVRYAVFRFTDNFEALRPDLDADACMDLLADLTGEDRFVTSIRKGDPAAALYYGLGFDASHALPGRSGCFVLTANEVAAATPAVVSILTMDADRRSQAVARMRASTNLCGSCNARKSTAAEQLPSCSGFEQFSTASTEPAAKLDRRPPPHAARFRYGYAATHPRGQG